jgi:hypothetical protein
VGDAFHPIIKRGAAGRQGYPFFRAKSHMNVASAWHASGLTALYVEARTPPPVLRRYDNHSAFGMMPM